MISGFNRQTRIIIAVISGLVILCFIAIFYRRSSDPRTDLPFAEAEERMLEISVQAVGELDSAHSLTIGSELKDDGKIIYLIEDGSNVNKGDILIRFDANPFQEKADQLRIKVSQWQSLVVAQQQLFEWEKIQAGKEIKTAEFDEQAAVLDLEKTQNGDGPLELHRLEEGMLEAKRKYDELAGYIKDLEELEKKGYSNPLEINQAKGNVEKLKKDSDLALQQLENYKNYVLPVLIKTAQSKVERCSMLVEEIKKGGGYKIGRAKAELEKSRQELSDYEEMYKSALTELERTTIRAPQSGLVVHKETYRDGELRKPRIGDVVIQNQPILFVPDISEMLAKVLIREVDLNKVDVGMRVRIVIDAYPNLMYSGVVSFIGILAERRNDLPEGEKYFKVNIKLSEKNNSLRPGMTCRVVIESRISPIEVLTIPVQAAVEMDGRHFCYLFLAGGFEQREILLGIRNEEYVEVKKGLQARETVYLSPPPKNQIIKTTLLADSKSP